jgi:hypothetical protein
MTGKPRRLAAALLSAAMLTAGVSAAGVSAAAGPAAAAAAGDGPHVSRAAARAVALGFHRPRGAAAAWQVLMRGAGLRRAGVRGAGVRGAGLRGAGLRGAGRSVPKPGVTSQLDGVYCTAFVNCWAVGSYESGGATLNQVLHWTGRKWARVSVPNPAGTGMGADNELSAVRCAKPSDCWAVGDREKPGGPPLDEALHWNGKKWAQVSTPTPGGTLKIDFNELFEVTCTSASNCWAVGDYGSQPSPGEEVILNQALHWNGKTWHQVSVPNPAGSSADDANVLDSVRCTSASNCWAVGAYGSLDVPETTLTLALHWTGKKWAKVTTPNPGGTAPGDLNELIGLSCTSASNCWATGEDGALNPEITFVTLALHWNGTKWAKVAVPSPGGTATGALNDLSAVSCTNATNCWAVGDYEHSVGTTGHDILILALRWTGKKWVQHTTPNPGGTANNDASALFGVRCTSTTRCWAVGDAETSTSSEFNQAMRWNGSKWATG